MGATILSVRGDFRGPCLTTKSKHTRGRFQMKRRIGCRIAIGGLRGKSVTEGLIVDSLSLPRKLTLSKTRSTIAMDNIPTIVRGPITKASSTKGRLGPRGCGRAIRGPIDYRIAHRKAK